MKIVAVPCQAAQLAPGDLFSSVGPEFWDHAHLGLSVDPATGKPRSGAIGVKVYIRTEVPFDPMQDGAEAPIWRLHIIPTVIEADLSDQALRALVAQDDLDPIEDKPRLEVVSDDDHDLESE